MINDSVINDSVLPNVFSFQCKPLINDSVLPNVTLLTTSKFDNFTLLTTSKFENFIISSDEIVSLVRNLNKGKANGPDDVSAHMLVLCDETIPLKLIYEQVLATGIFPNIWKSANLTPILKKGDKQLVKYYRPISLLPICGNIFEKIIFNQLYLFFTANNLITKNQSGFRSGDSTTTSIVDPCKRNS